MIIRKALLAVLITALFMVIYESLKELFLSHLTKWESHIITIIISSLVSGVAAYFVIGKMNILIKSLNKEISNRLSAEENIKQQLKEKEILLKEVHHRIKNNIASIESMLYLHIESISNAESINILQDAISRIKSMRIIYDKLLLSNGYKDASVEHYLKDLITAIMKIFPEKNRITVLTEINDFTLDINKLFSLGIIVNELITNSMKYGFINKESGIINIKLLKKQNEIILIVQDNGNGLPENFDIDKSAGFGLMLIRMLTEQLNGTFSIENDNGAECIIKFNI